MKLVFVSTNEGKISEAERALGMVLEVARIKLEEIQSFDQEEIVKRKAEYAFERVGKPLIVDDVGLAFTAWNGFPGPFIKYVEDIVGYEKVLKMLQNEVNREVLIRSVIGYHDGRGVHIFTGEVKGVFTTESRGAQGWGFDPYFLPDGQSMTFAEMGPEKKGKISHRALAFKNLRIFLDQ